MSKIAKVFLALTAFGPVLLTYAAVSAMNCEYWHAAWFVTSCILLVLVCAGLLRFARTRLQSRTYRTATVETADNEVFGLLLVYVLPLITRDLAAYNWYVWILVTFLFCLVVAASYGHHFNPLLMFMGYHFTPCACQRRLQLSRSQRTSSACDLGTYAARRRSV